MEVRSNDPAVSSRLEYLLGALGPPEAGAPVVQIRVDVSDASGGVQGVIYESRVDGALLLTSPDLDEHEMVVTRALNARRLAAERDLLHIHGGGVVRAGRAVLLPGRAGSGKSTLTAALVRGGWEYLTDEQVVLQPSDGRVIPYRRPITLRAASWSFFAGVEGVPAEPPAESGRAQVEVAPQALGRLHGPDPVEVSTVVQPRFLGGGADDLVPLATAAETVELLATSCHDLERLGWRGAELLVRIAAGCRGWRLDFDDIGTAALRVAQAFEAAPTCRVEVRHIPPTSHVPEGPPPGTILRAAGAHAWAFADGSTVVYSPSSLTLARLDAVGTATWKRLGRPCPEATLRDRAPGDEPEVLESRRRWVDDLTAAGLLVEGDRGG